MARKDIGNKIDRENRNAHNDNYKELYKEVNDFTGSITEELYERIIDGAKLNWKEPVASQSNLPSNATEGDTRMARDTGKVYRYDGSKWVEIQQIDAGPVNELDSRLTSQLADKANLNDLDVLDDKKADKISLSQGLNGKRDKNVEIGMSDLDQEVREAFTGGSVPVVGEDAVGTINLKDESITNEKLSKNFNVGMPWLSDDSFDLDYIWDEKNYLVSGSAKNNPYPYTALLETKRSTTVNTSSQCWITQTVTMVRNGSKSERSFRSLIVNESTNEIVYKTEWKESVSDLDGLKKLMQDTWLNSEEDDLNDYLKPGTILVSSVVKNNPISEGSSVLINSPAVSTFTSGNEWVRQEITSTREPVITYDRIVAIGGDGTISYVRPWNRYLKESDLTESENPWNNKVWVALGTSMTARDKYTSVVADRLNLNLDNRGVGSGGITSSAYAGNTTMQAIDALENFKGLLTVEVGPNDSTHPLGEIGDTDETTFYGCLYTAFNKIAQKTTARCVVLTMTSQWADIDNSVSPAQRGQRRTVLEQWSRSEYKTWKMQKAIKEMAEWFALPVIDVKGESGLAGYHLNDQTSVDWIHHSDLGGQIVGEFIAKKLISIQPFPGELNLASDL